MLEQSSQSIQRPNRHHAPPGQPDPAERRDPRLPYDEEPLQLAGPAGGGPEIPNDLPTGGSGGGADIPPEAFKPRRFNPLMLVVALALVALFAGLLWFGIEQSAEKMTVEQRMEVQKDIFVLPGKEQIPKWRKWAADKRADVDLRAEALTQLALLNDPDGIKLAIEAFESTDHGLRATAAMVLTHYGSPDADDGKKALNEALKDASAADKRQIVWALVELGDETVFNTAMDMYRGGDITTVQRLEGGRAFDPLKVTKLVSLDELATRGGDESAAIRQLVATLLSEDADPKYTDTLIKLVNDPEIVVAREAATGLGKIADEKARKPLVEALRKADKDNRQKFLEALRDGIGGEGLVLALDTVTPESESESRNWFQHEQLFNMMHALADPRAGDAIVKWVEAGKRHPHWRTEAGIALAEIGDVRGATYLGERMGVENKDIYVKEKFWQKDAGGHLTRTDRPRIVGARMLADLAVMHPDKRDVLIQGAAEPVLKWMTDRPQPHANGLRFLAAARYEKALPPMRDWAFPKDALPGEGAQPPFPTAYETAQSGLRYIGWMQDDRSHKKLMDQFDRKDDAKMDITQAGLEGAGLAMLGMCLRAVALGAAEGLSQWGPQKDQQVANRLIEFIEDKNWHEEAREAACATLAWVADDETLGKVVEKVGKFSAEKNPRDQFIGACYAVTLTRKPIPSAVGMMVDLLQPSLEVGVRVALGRAIGVAGLKDAPDAEKKLFELLKDPELRNPAALALILGGSSDTAARTVATFAEKDSALALADLKDMYFRAFGYWSDADLDRGNLYRWVANAKAISRVKIGGAPQEWARLRLQAQFDNLQYDNGPHSETRVVLRFRLLKAARSDDPAARKGAIMTLQFMKEKGSLMALRHEAGETGELAKRAFHELMNPALVEPEDLKDLQDEQNNK